MTVVDPVPADPTAAPVDQAFLDLIAKLGPVFNEVAKAAITEAIAATPTTTYRPGIVQGVSATERTVSVLLDGDSTAITAQILGDNPWTNARVMIEFVPPSAVFVAGIISAPPLPAGVMIDYAGPITEHADASTAQPTSNQPPPGWLWCAGQAVSRSTYSALFTAISTTHGAGDGATTFNVPDRRGRIGLPLDNMGGSDAGRLSMANTLGGVGGSNVIAVGNLPASGVSFTPTGSVSITSVTGTVNISDPTHAHNTSNTALVTGGTNAYNNAGAGSFDTANMTATAASTGITASFSGGAGSGSFSGDGGTTSNLGSGNEALPPYMLCHVIIKH